MSSKASEILGVSAKRPHVPPRRAIASRDYPSNVGDAGLADNKSRVPSSRGSKISSSRGHRGSTSQSVESVSNSVRFAEKPLSSRGSKLALRFESNPEPLSPSVSSRRAPPSSWRGLASRAGGSSASINSRTSEESVATLQSQSAKEPSPRSRTLLKSALSRLTLRPSKSRSSLASTRDPRIQSNVSTAMHTASTSRQATPRALSPIGTRIGSSAAPATQSAPVRDMPSGPPKRRLNSRMPIEIDRPPTRNWFDGLDDADFDDANLPPQKQPMASEAPLQSHSNGSLSTANKGARRFPRPLIIPPRPPSDLENHPRDVLVPEANLSNGGPYQSSVYSPSHEIKKRRVKQPELEPHNFSILNLSDSDEGQATPSIHPQLINQPQVHRSKNSYDSSSSLKRDLPLPRPPPSRSGKIPKTSSRVVSVLKINEDEAETSPSLPSLVESGSSRQASVVSSASHGRSIPLQTTASTSLRTKTIVGSSGSVYFDSRDSSDQAKLMGVDSEDEGLMIAQSYTRDFGYSSPSDPVMTALSPEEVAWLLDMRRNRAETLGKLNPSNHNLGDPVSNQMQPQSAGSANEASLEQARGSITRGEFYRANNRDMTRQGSRGTQNGVAEDELPMLDKSDMAVPNDFRSMVEQQVVAQSRKIGRRKSASSSEAAPASDSPGTITIAEPSRQEHREDTAQEDVIGPEHLFTSPHEPTSASHTPETVTLADSNGSSECLDITMPEIATRHTPELSSTVNAVERVEQGDSSEADQHRAATRRVITRARQESISYAEARSRFEKPSGRTSLLPVPKKGQAITGKGVGVPASTETKPRTRRIPVPLGGIRQPEITPIHSTMQYASSDDAVSLQDQELPTPKLANFPQPPGTGDSSGENISDESQSSDRELGWQHRQDTGAMDVLEAWHALGGGGGGG